MEQRVAVSVARLVGALHEPRDARVKMSILLQDHMYVVDIGLRQELQEISQEVVNEANGLTP